MRHTWDLAGQDVIPALGKSEGLRLNHKWCGVCLRHIALAFDFVTSCCFKSADDGKLIWGVLLSFSEVEKSSVHREGFLSDGKEYKTKSTRVHNVKDIAPERSGPTDGRYASGSGCGCGCPSAIVSFTLWMEVVFRSHWNERECGQCWHFFVFTVIRELTLRNGCWTTHG